MNKDAKYRGIVILIVLTLFTLQAVWLASFHRIYMQDMTKSANGVFRESLSDEIYYRLERHPEARLFAKFDEPDTAKFFPVEYYLDALVENGNDVDLHTLDSLFRDKMKANHIAFTSIEYEIYDHKRDYEDSESYGWNTLITRPLYIRNSSEKFVQAVVTLNNRPLVYTLLVPLIASGITLLLVILCIVYQFKTIKLQNNLAKIREEFTYAMIHDMKTPIGTISMAGNALKSGMLEGNPELKRNYFRIINEESNHLMTLSNKILTLARLECSNSHINKKQIDVGNIITDVSRVHIVKSAKKVQFNFDFRHKSRLNADPDYFREAVSNLIDNSIKYSGDSVKIDISTEEHDNHIYISVKDNGFGIPLKEKEIIFNRFHRGHDGGNATEGFGLGLNLVLNVVTELNGYINVNSVEGEFTEFTIVLPVVGYN